MHISHIAIWSTHLEELKNFYITYFNGTSHEKYINPKKGFESYFVSFDQGFASLEIMQRQDITTPALKASDWPISPFLPVVKKLYWNSPNVYARMALRSQVSHGLQETAISKVQSWILKEIL